MLIQQSGLGRLRCNTLVIGFKNNWYEKVLQLEKQNSFGIPFTCCV